MLCGGDALPGALTALLGALLALSRSPVLAALLTAGPFLLLHVFSLEPASPHSARRVLRPHGAPARIAHRGGAHDAPENTLAAVRQVSPAVPAERRGTRRARAEVRRRNCRAVSLTSAWGRKVAERLVWRAGRRPGRRSLAKGGSCVTGELCAWAALLRGERPQIAGGAKLGGNVDLLG